MVNLPRPEMVNLVGARSVTAGIQHTMFYLQTYQYLSKNAFLELIIVNS
jgi:hypothetical protein